MGEGKHQVNRERLWQSLMDMARIGPGVAGGNKRLALTEEDRQGRDLFCGWARDAGCTVSVDGMGNIFARRPGKRPDAEPVLTGSHLDTQPTGGRFDGVFGVLAGLEVLRALNDRKLETLRPVELVVWTNEEGSRFQPAMIGSGVFSGRFTLAEGHARADADGVTLGDALERIGYKGTAQTGARPIHAYLEAHIEQGPILETERKTIGVVTGIQGVKWFKARVAGMNAHAGTTPMEVRRDPLVGASKMVQAIDRITRATRPDCVGTVGEFKVGPGSINVINAEVKFSIDLRCPDGDVLRQLESNVRGACKEIAQEMGLTLELDEIWYSEPTVFHPDIVNAVAQATAQQGYTTRRIVSGAGHDAKYLSDICPTAMIFIPCEKGISHNEAENITPDQAQAGADVLLNSILTLANQE
jgi:beta-ureidopropionase / N-carbamoyl-L-amino-acid hydrolase